jgi:hypothetical protein
MTMKWNKLSISERNKYIQLALQNGIRDIDVIANAYEDAGFFGAMPQITPPPVVGAQVATTNNEEQRMLNEIEYQKYLANPDIPYQQALMDSETAKKINTALSYFPIIGTAMDVKSTIEDPTDPWNWFYSGLGLASDVVGGRAALKLSRLMFDPAKAAAQRAARQAATQGMKASQRHAYNRTHPIFHQDNQLASNALANLAVILPFGITDFMANDAQNGYILTASPEDRVKALESKRERHKRQTE